MNEAGFYKRDPESGELLYAPNAVYAPGFTLLKENHADYHYPMDGWVWFESLEAAVTELPPPPLPAESLAPPPGAPELDTAEP